MNADVDGKHTRVANGLLFGKVVINDARDVGDPLKRHDGLVAQNALQVLRGSLREIHSLVVLRRRGDAMRD